MSGLQARDDDADNVQLQLIAVFLAAVRVLWLSSREYFMPVK